MKKVLIGILVGFFCVSFAVAEEIGSSHSVSAVPLGIGWK